MARSNHQKWLGIPNELHAALKDAAARRHIPLAPYAVQALSKHLEQDAPDLYSRSVWDERARKHREKTGQAHPTIADIQAEDRRGTQPSSPKRQRRSRIATSTSPSEAQ